VPVLVVGWRVPAEAAGDASALELLSTLLTGRDGSRLSRRLVAEEQSCLFARTGRDRQRDATLFWAAAALRPGADTAAVESSLVGEIERLAGEPIAGEELDRARKQLELALLLGRQSANDRGQVLGAADLIAGDWRDADRQLERLRALTPTDLQQAAARTLVAARRYLVWMTPAPGGAARGGGGGQ
jgi:zinc protease